MSRNIEDTLRKFEQQHGLYPNQQNTSDEEEQYGLCYDCNRPDEERYSVLCFDCNRSNTSDGWCQYCNSRRFQQDFNKWTSGNEFIDKFIQDTQLKARDSKEVMEWIPYNYFRNIQYLAQGGFSIVYKAILLNGRIYKWGNEEKQWKRYSNKLNDDDYENAKQQDSIMSPLNQNEKEGWYVVLKSLNNSSNINENFLNEFNPETLNYMIAMEYKCDGNFRSNLMIRKYNPYDKYHNLRWIAKSLKALHKCNLVHGDLHSGNLLSDHRTWACISDFGLSKPADKSIKSNEIYGVLPYIAPEVLRGKPYTKAADIYSFGIIMWEMSSGIPAFNNIPHDFDLSLDICKGLRPKNFEVPNIFDNIIEQKIFENIEVKYTELMIRCWDPDPNKRPTAKNLYDHLREWHVPYSRKPVPENEPIIQNHPSTCYTSRKFDYSTKLNEMLNQGELSSKIIINDSDDEATLSESLVEKIGWIFIPFLHISHNCFLSVCNQLSLSGNYINFAALFIITPEKPTKRD
ncbi:kinase-like domain-containing protein [Rhizophagus clarus]|uniref:Kinase-like domain-containing protein n=1 Tax=Rhizophagus clarus TaxID=94130 RepID=A0A8H3L9N1_9GLOM|nr:kinase-like domain-containing protein [Rhizophagus clarus]